MNNAPTKYFHVLHAHGVFLTSEELRPIESDQFITGVILDSFVPWYKRLSFSNYVEIYVLHAKYNNDDAKILRMEHYEYSIRRKEVEQPEGGVKFIWDKPILNDPKVVDALEKVGLIDAIELRRVYYESIINRVAECVAGEVVKYRLRGRRFSSIEVVQALQLIGERISKGSPELSLYFSTSPLTVSPELKAEIATIESEFLPEKSLPHTIYRELVNINVLPSQSSLRYSRFAKLRLRLQMLRLQLKILFYEYKFKYEDKYKHKIKLIRIRLLGH